ncbi:hypothetical protein IKQ_06149 [Bacillus cereus VDM053]|nr:hypothetical protein IKQ_06149 [Bacillus cereus VDM053]
MYYFELEQKEKINNRITIPMGVITLLAGLAVYYFKGLSNIELSIWGWAFFAIYGSYIMTIFIAIRLVFKAYYNYKYSYLPRPDIIENDITAIINYYDSNYEQYFSQDGSKEELIEKDINNAVYSYYKNSTSSNIGMNERKLKYLRYAGNTLLIAIFLAALSIIPYQFSIKENKEIKVEVKQFNEISKKIEEGVKKMGQTSNTNQNNNPAPPPKPQPSEPRVVPEEFDGSNLTESNK